ncbi:uncharacterized protein dbf4b isoform X3 [Brachyhypopomus gauderio]|uniref:uncharacterized protein dbf4b isoform X3 n=1 Tax=Brachyhypopomus gauderio TaxID=698409 RepID=UPI0040428EB6
MPSGLRICDLIGALAPGSHPLEGKSFYLDEVKSRSSSILIELIGRLGGKVESFLNKDVSVVVTGNREAMPTRQAECSTLRKVKGEADCSPVLQRQCSAQHPGTPRPPVCGSRGKALLEKALRQEKSWGSVLSRASSWGVKIVSVDEFLKFVDRLHAEISCLRNHRTEKAREPSRPRVVRAGVLKADFVKVEDSSRKYRPLHIQSMQFPTLSYLGRFSPFETPAPARPQPRREAHQAQETVSRSAEMVSSGCKAPAALPHTPSHRKNTGYCECCQTSYQHLDQHLECELHRGFVLDVHNYAVVDQLVASMNAAFMCLPDSRDDKQVLRLSIGSPASLNLCVETKELTSYQADGDLHGSDHLLSPDTADNTSDLRVVASPPPRPVESSIDAPPRPVESSIDAPPRPVESSLDAPPRPVESSLDAPPRPVESSLDAPPRPVESSMDAPPRPVESSIDAPPQASLEAKSGCERASGRLSVLLHQEVPVSSPSLQDGDGMGLDGVIDVPVKELVVHEHPRCAAGLQQPVLISSTCSHGSKEQPSDDSKRGCKSDDDHAGPLRGGQPQTLSLPVRLTESGHSSGSVALLEGPFSSAAPGLSFPAWSADLRVRVNPRKRRCSFPQSPSPSKKARKCLGQMSDPTNENASHICTGPLPVAEERNDSVKRKPDTLLQDLLSGGHLAGQISAFNNVATPNDLLPFQQDTQEDSGEHERETDQYLNVEPRLDPGLATAITTPDPPVSSELGPPDLYPFYHDDELQQQLPPCCDPPTLSPSVTIPPPLEGATHTAVSQASAASLLSQSFSSFGLESALVPSFTSSTSSESDWDSGLLARLAPAVHLPPRGGRCELDLLLQRSCTGVQDGSYASRLCSVLQPAVPSPTGFAGRMSPPALCRQIETLDMRITQTLGV